MYAQALTVSNNIIVIPDNPGSTTFAIIVIIITALFVAYQAVSIAWQNRRYRKLKKAQDEMIEREREEEFLNKYVK